MNKSQVVAVCRLLLLAATLISCCQARPDTGGGNHHHEQHHQPQQQHHHPHQHQHKHNHHKTKGKGRNKGLGILEGPKGVAIGFRRIKGGLVALTGGWLQGQASYLKSKSLDARGQSLVELGKRIAGPGPYGPRAPWQ